MFEDEDLRVLLRVGVAMMSWESSKTISPTLNLILPRRFFEVAPARASAAAGLDGESADMNGVDAGRLDEEADDAGAEGELAQGDDGIVGAGGDDIVRRIDAQAAAGDLKTVEQRDVERIELDLAVEARAEGLNDAALEDGAGATQHDLGNDGEHDDAEQERDAQPLPYRSLSVGSPDRWIGS